MSTMEQQSIAGTMESPVSDHNNEDITFIMADAAAACTDEESNANVPLMFINNTIVDVNVMKKGKRTKRLRPADQFPIPSPPLLINKIIDSSSPESDVPDENGGFRATTAEEMELVEDRDMANCLILLAQGEPINNVDADHSNNSHNLPTINNSATACSQIRYGGSLIQTPHQKANNNRVIINGGYGYECKTCYKTFASFQALGGHRSSCHKKPRKEPQHVHERKMEVLSDNDDHDFIPTTADVNYIQFRTDNYDLNKYSNNTNAAAARSCKSRFMKRNHYYNNNNTSSNSSFSSSSDSLSLQLVNTNVEPYNTTGTGSNSNITKSPRVHECAVCGAVFASGQALGGHMRKHRGTPNSSRNMTNNNVNALNPNHHYYHYSSANHGRYLHDHIVLSLSPTKTDEEKTVKDVDKTSTEVNLSLGLNLNFPAPGLTVHHHHHHDMKDHHPQLDHQQQSNQLELSLMPPTVVHC